MSSGRTELVLRPAMVRRSVQDGDVARYPESHYLDYEVDGFSLTERFPAARGLITPMSRPWLASVPEAVEQVRGQSEMEGLRAGRVALLVCAECGDLACGALTAALGITTRDVRWSDFLWENGYAPATTVESGSTAFTFERDAYMAAFSDAYARIARLPYDELAHEGRKFLWPWQWGWRLPPQ